MGCGAQLAGTKIGTENVREKRQEISEYPCRITSLCLCHPG